MQLTQEQLKQVQQTELEILDEFLRICNKYNLKYFLAGGTCLGAIRHQGFIPWDDDIDVSMPREDYDRFAEVAQQELGDKYFYQNYFTDPRCGLVFAKVRKNGTVFSSMEGHHLPIHQGVWIDIFPYDNLPNDQRIQERTFNKVQLLRNLYIVKCGFKLPSTRSKVYLPAYWCAKLVCIFLPLKWHIKKMDSACRKQNSPQNPFVIPYGAVYGLKKELLPKEMICQFVDVSFEGRTCKTLLTFDQYLTQLYGDYMQLPPEKDRTTTHEVYRLEI